MLKRIRSWFCRHHFPMSKAWRDEEGMIHCVCIKCSREYVACYGLSLPGKVLIGWKDEAPKS